MGITTGYYTMKNNSTGMCVENTRASIIGMAKCAKEEDINPSMIWRLDDVNKSICNHRSKACLAHSASNTLTLSPFDPKMDEMRWNYDPKYQTICNKKTNMCLETGGKLTPGNKFGVAPDGPDTTLKWQVKPALCSNVESFPTVKLNPQSHNTICKGVCMLKQGQYTNSYQNTGVTGYCKCAIPTACTL